MTIYTTLNATMYLTESPKEDNLQQKQFVETVYSSIKKLASTKLLNSDNVAALAELTTELANRLKEEEGAEQKG